MRPSHNPETLHWIRHILLLCFLNLFNTSFAAQKHPTDSIAYYIDIYGEIRPETDSQVDLAHKIFARLNAVVDSNAKLVVTNNKKKQWAMVLLDGNIVLSKKALETMHLNANSQEIAARIAFVLGHEIAHLSHHDHWHGDFRDFFESKVKFDNTSTSKDNKEREFKADDTGFIYAALAGFAVEFLVQNTPGTPTFFDLWIEQSQNKSFSDGNTPQTRSKLLQRRLKKLRENISLFEFGVRLSHFGYCDDAIAFFETFLKIYPGREVLNNLGFCYLQLARQAMDPSRANLYWLPMMLDGETRAGAYILRNGVFLKNLKQVSRGEGEGYLIKAEYYLKHAVEADKKYLPAQLNLASTLLYLGRPHGVRDLLADSKRLAPNNLSIESLDALALYEQSDVDQDLWPIAVKKFKQLTKKPDATPELIFNLARLLSLRPRPMESKIYWNQLATIANRIPKPIKAIVCNKQSSIKAKACSKKVSRLPRLLPWKWPLDVNGKQSLILKAGSIIEKWTHINIDWSNKGLQGDIYQRPEDKSEVLVLDQFVHMQVLKQPELKSIQELSNYCEKPLRKHILSNGIVWSCRHWAVLSQDDKIKEAWWIAN